MLKQLLVYINILFHNIFAAIVNNGICVEENW